jgi:hypothetical protein
VLQLPKVSAVLVRLTTAFESLPEQALRSSLGVETDRSAGKGRPTSADPARTYRMPTSRIGRATLPGRRQTISSPSGERSRSRVAGRTVRLTYVALLGLKVGSELHARCRAWL